MTTLTKLTPKVAANRLKSGDAVLIDIREADEFAREHIPGSISVPISSIDRADLKLDAGQTAIFHCKSGMRTDANCALLAQHVEDDAYVLEGGLDAWRATGLPTEKDTSAPLEINRQVQITAGSFILLGVLLGWFVAAPWFALPAFVGAGLMFAGVSGWCGMATLLQAMPWNRRHVA